MFHNSGLTHISVPTPDAYILEALSNSYDSLLRKLFVNNPKSPNLTLYYLVKS